MPIVQGLNSRRRLGDVDILDVEHTTTQLVSRPIGIEDLVPIAVGRRGDGEEWQFPSAQLLDEGFEIGLTPPTLTLSEEEDFGDRGFGYPVFALWWSANSGAAAARQRRFAQHRTD